jgi:cyclomaltodextrinase
MGNENLLSDSSAPELPEFIFGELSTEAGRLRQARSDRSGLAHDVRRTVLAPGPGQPVEIRVQVGPDLPVASLELRWSCDPQRDPAEAGQPASEVGCAAMRRTRLDWDDLAWGYLEEWSATIPGQPAGTPVSYAIRATTPSGSSLGCPSSASQPRSRPRTYTYVTGRRPIPTWIREAVIYQIFVDRFAPDPGLDFQNPGDLAGFHGGTLRGITTHLDHLQALGITCLWLTPIFPSPSHHGYDPIDPGAIEPRFGCLADWDVLVAGARARGMRLLLDYVVNHVSSEHPRFVAAQADPHDPACAWFRFRRHPHDYDCFFDVPSQPEVDSDHPDVQAYFLQHARYWLERGCDGFRLDYAANVSHAFWSLFREGTRSLNPEAVTLGEITQPPAVMRSYTGRMDGCLDFRLLELLRAFFAHRSLGVGAFAHALGQHLDYFGKDLVLPSFLDNHDMNRFLWLVGGERRRLKLAALFQFWLPQPPILYYGTEVGLNQRQACGRLEESRLPMLWGEQQDRDLLTFFQSVIAFRRAHPQLLEQTVSPWLLDEKRHLLGLRCGDLTLIVHNADAGTELQLPAGWTPAEVLLQTDPLPDLDPGAGRLPLGPWTGLVLRLRPGSPSPPAADPAAV